jgi:hypothetical protein
MQRKGFTEPPRGLSFVSIKSRTEATKNILHKEWCKQNFVSFSLEKRPVFRATIKPAYQGRFFHPVLSQHASLCRYLSAKGWSKT